MIGQIRKAWKDLRIPVRIHGTFSSLAFYRWRKTQAQLDAKGALS